MVESGGDFCSSYQSLIAELIK